MLNVEVKCVLSNIISKIVSSQQVISYIASEDKN